MSLEKPTALIELNGKLERMMDGIEIVKERQVEMADDVAKIKEAVYNPDEGIYARIRELEAFKKQSSKLIWIIVTTLIGLGMHQVLSNM
jgi:hypothetical protein